MRIGSASVLAAMETEGQKYHTQSKATTGNPCWEGYFSFLCKQGWRSGEREAWLTEVLRTGPYGRPGV